MLTLELADGTRTPTLHAKQSVYNAALRGIESRAIDGSGRVVFSTGDLPALVHDGEPLPYPLRRHFTDR